MYNTKPLLNWLETSGSKHYVANPHFTGKHSGEVAGVWLSDGEIVTWNIIGEIDGDLVITGYTITKRGVDADNP